MYRVRTHSIDEYGKHYYDMEEFYELNNARRFATLDDVVECTIVQIIEGSDMVRCIASSVAEAWRA